MIGNARDNAAILTREKEIYYNPEGVLREFFMSEAPFCGVRGPIGSGKTVACVMKLWYRSIFQQPDQYGVRPTRWGVFRGTYGELKSTTIKTWQDWLGDVGEVIYDAPIRARLKYMLPDGTMVDSEWWFVSMDKPKDVKKVLSMELTGAWVNEAREFKDWTLVQAIMDRLPRYPAAGRVPVTWTGILADTNSPDDDHWWHEKAEEEKPLGFDFFTQPPALILKPPHKVDPVPADPTAYLPNPRAENIRNLQGGFQYYFSKIPGRTADHIAIYLRNEYGSLEEGRPVYKGAWSAPYHVSDVELVAIKGRRLLLGWDFATNPAVVIGQMSPRGQLRILDELCGQGIDVETFTKTVVLPYLNTEYSGFKFSSVGDPSGRSTESDGKSVFKRLALLGLPTTPASSNAIEGSRLAAVRWILGRNIGAMPAIKINEKCRMLIKGFNSKYQYKRIQVSGDEKYQIAPDKNAWSHPHDALQALCLMVRSAHDTEDAIPINAPSTEPADAIANY